MAPTHARPPDNYRGAHGPFGLEKEVSAGRGANLKHRAYGQYHIGGPPTKNHPDHARRPPPVAQMAPTHARPPDNYRGAHGPFGLEKDQKGPSVSRQSG